MNSDIRLCIGWNSNPKIVKLRRKLGSDGVLGLITLWTYAGAQRTDGVLAGILGFYRCSREAFVHSDRLFAKYRRDRSGIGD